MEGMNPIDVFEKIKEKYLSFVLTTICRSNSILYNELKHIFLDNELIWRDIILQTAPKYLVGDEKTFNSLLFDSLFKELLKSKISNPYHHQLSAWKTILKGDNCIISTGTGSGKTEAFLMPLLNHCITQKHEGVQAIIIYPLKALANDQGKRIGKLLDDINEIYKSDIRYGIFDADTGKRNASGNKSEINNKEEIWTNPPNILITNYVMLERILLNPKYSSILKNSKVKFVVLDELHYYRGAQGIDVSLLVRRLQFHLSLQQNITNIQYLGTSATLGDPKSEEVKEFLLRLFNVEFKSDCIVTSNFSKDFETDILFKPKFYKKLGENKVNLNKNEIRAHSYFCAPPHLYRCHSCNKIYFTKMDQCSVCKSKLIFEIVTCRQCGEEYINYEFEVPKNQENSDIIFEDLDIIGFLNNFNNQKEQKKDGAIILSKKLFKNSNRKLKICMHCLKLYSDNIIKCESCNESDFIAVYAIENPEKIDILNHKTNNKYCPSCNFKECRQSLIVPVSKISDENCSHIVFDEFFMALPENRRKLLVFTDNVQRTSKFAREIEETHLKNIARAELQKRIEKLVEPLYLSNLIFEIINSIKRKTTINEYLELSLKKELYEELMSSGKKVASLMNRGLFKLQVAELDKFSEDDKKNIFDAFEVFKEQNQILSYYEIVNRDEFHSFNQFKDNLDLLMGIYKKINKLDRKPKGKIDLSIPKEIIDLLRNKGFLNECEEKHFFKEEFIEVCKIEKEDVETNYYGEWKRIDNIPILKSRIDTGKTPPDRRSQIESDFKESKGNVNFLVATPTLELGIDVGDLDVIGLLYAPPSPAQYVQRTGRSGRCGQSTIAVTYLSKRTLDSTYFYEPEGLVEGKINPPAFVLDLEIPIKKALFSVFFSYVLYETKFREKTEGLAWSNINNWEKHFDKIKEYWKSYESDFKIHLNKYLKLSNIDFNTDNLIDNWIKQLEDFIELQNSLKSKDFQRNMDVFNYFKEAGLLPDYAFGTGGSIVLVNGRAPIKGFNIKEVCPPTTLDYDKSRFNCYKIDLYPANKIKIITENFKQCPSCKEVMYINKNETKCPLCKDNLIENTKYIIEPKVIRAKRSTFSLIQKRVNWRFKVINLPKEIKFDSNMVSKPIVCEIGRVFDSVTEDGNKKNYFLCELCGELYSKNSNRSSFDNHVHIPANKTIGTKFKTRAIVLDYLNLNLDSPLTFLNTLIAAATLEVGCEDGEISGMILENTSKLILFDNIDGGVGFVDVISKKWINIINGAIKLCEYPCCKDGCIRCIGSFWRQNDLDFLRKRDLLPFLYELRDKNEFN